MVEAGDERESLRSTTTPLARKVLSGLSGPSTTPDFSRGLAKTRKPSGFSETKRETRVVKVSQEAVGRQLSRLPVAGRNMQRMLPKSAASVTASPDGGNCRRKAREER